MSPTTKAQRHKSVRGLLAAAWAGLRMGRLWQICLAFGLLALMVVGARGLWQRLRPHVESRAEYLVAADQIEITPPPEWIRADVKTEAIRSRGFSHRLSILDERLTDDISQTFALHPWVARVAAVQTTYPSRIKVELIYRRPVAMVEVYGGLLPVDAEGVLLPTEDFSPDQAATYPRIAGIASSPLGPLGTRWGDARLEAAVKLAALLQDAWPKLLVHHLQLQPHQGTASTNPVLELVTRKGTVMVWGSAPGAESAAEPKAAEKLRRLERLAGAEGSLAAVPAEERDLRH